MTATQRDAMCHLMKEHPGLRRAEYVELGMSGRKMSRSGAYRAIKDLEVRGEVVERRGHLYLRGTEKFADPSYVRRLCSTVANQGLPETVRRSNLHDLRVLANERPFVIDGHFLTFLGTALEERGDPLRPLVGELITQIVKLHDAAVRTSDTSYEPKEELKALWRGSAGHPGIGERILASLHSQPAETAWALEVLPAFLDLGPTRRALVDLLVEFAFSPEVSMPTFQSFEPTIVRVLVSALDDDYGEVQRFKGILEGHLAASDREEIDRARELKNGLRSEFNRVLG